jgi:hypothetical protein
MNQIVQPVSSGRWVGRVVVGVLVGEGVWGLIVSLTRDLIMPFLARQTGEVSQSSQNVNVPGIFTAVIGLCLAGLAAVILNFWVNRPVRGTPVKAARVGTIVAGASSASLSIAPPAPATSVARVTATAAPAPAPAVQQAPTPAPVAGPKLMAPPPAPVAAQPAPVAPPAAKPVKPKPPREIQYNIVGEPISPMEEDE